MSANEGDVAASRNGSAFWAVVPAPDAARATRCAAGSAPVGANRSGVLARAAVAGGAKRAWRTRAAARPQLHAWRTCWGRWPQTLTSGFELSPDHWQLTSALGSPGGRYSATRCSAAAPALAAAAAAEKVAALAASAAPLTAVASPSAASPSAASPAAASPAAAALAAAPGSDLRRAWQDPQLPPAPPLRLPGRWTVAQLQLPRA